MSRAFIVRLLILLGNSLATIAWGAASPDANYLRFRLTADPVTLDWNQAATSFEAPILMNIMEGLTGEATGAGNQQARPALAEKWEIAADGRTYTFTLRAGVRWSDGRPLRARDFQDSWLRLLDPKTRSSYADFLFDVEGAEAYHRGKSKGSSAVGIKVVDERHLQVKLRRIVPYFLHLTSFWVTFPVRLDLIKKYGKAWTAPGKLATVGPYQVTDWTPGKQIRLTRNTGYYGGLSEKGGGSDAPAIQTIEAVVEPDDQKARQSFEGGKLDFLLDTTTEDLLRAKASDGQKKFRVEQFPYWATYYLGFNAQAPALRDAAIRRAIATAVELDRPGLPALLQGGQTAATGWIPEGLDGHRVFPALGTLYDARGALTRAGYVDGRGFPKVELWIEKFDGAERVAAFLTRTLHDKLGVDVDPHIGSATEYREARQSGRAQLMAGHWGADFPDQAGFFRVFASGSGHNYLHWSNADYDRLLAEAEATLDPGSRQAAYDGAEKILLQKDAVVLPLFYKSNTVLIGPRVKKLELSPLNYLFLKEARLND